MRVSVVIPMRNAERTIADALESVLAQTLSPGQVIVVDDGSTDRSVEAAQAAAPHALVLRQAPSGAPAARNLGIAHATGELVAFLDADDRMTLDRLALQVALLDLHAAAGLAFGLQQVFADGERPWVEPAPARDGAVREGMSNGSMLCRRAVFDAVGPFDAALAGGELLEWFARAQDLGITAVSVPRVVFYRRVHDANATKDRAAAATAYAQAIKQVLDRRRSRDGK